MAGSARSASLSQGSGAATRPRSSSTSFTMPPFCMYMKRKRKATTTKGTAQGDTTSARMAPATGPSRFSSSSASAPPSSTEAKTVPNV